MSHQFFSPNKHSRVVVIPFVFIFEISHTLFHHQIAISNSIKQYKIIFVWYPFYDTYMHSIQFENRLFLSYQFYFWFFFFTTKRIVQNYYEYIHSPPNWNRRQLNHRTIVIFMRNYLIEQQLNQPNRQKMNKN